MKSRSSPLNRIRVIHVCFIAPFVHYSTPFTFYPSIHNCQVRKSPEEKVYNYNTKRVSDLKENARVTLPKPAIEIHEAGIVIRRRNLKKTVNEFK